jgi:hypothetical protein
MYLAILRCFTVVVRKKKLEKFKTTSWFPHHDNVAAHRSLLVKDFLAKYNVTAQERTVWRRELSSSRLHTVRITGTLDICCHITATE